MKKTIQIKSAMTVQRHAGRVEAMYVKIRDGKISRTIEVDPEVLVDIDLGGRVVGIELLEVPKDLVS